MPKQRLPLALAAFLALLTCSLHGNLGTVTGVRLYGAGSPNVASIFSAWNSAYLYSRDDVSVTYSSEGGVVSAFGLYAQGDVDFLCADRGTPVGQAAQYGNLTQFPLVGQAVVMTYNLPALNETDAYLVIDREVLGRIWAGDITTWDHQSIRDRNPDIAAKLPSAPIVIGYNENDVLTIVEVLKRSLESFSPQFRDALAAANRTFGSMPPAQAGHAEDAGCSTALRLQWLAEHNNSLTFVNYADAVKAGFPWMNMVNRAGRLVRPATTSVQSAMADFSDQYNSSNFTVDILDAPGNHSWPISYMTFFSMAQAVEVFDCTNIQELLNFVAWVHTNDAASSAAVAINVAPLDVSLRMRAIALLNTVQCNGQPAFEKSFLIGIGTPLPLWIQWGISWSSATTGVKYYQENSAIGKEHLAQYNEDFGVTTNGLSADSYELMDDAALLPATALAVVPGFNVPELRGLTLVLDFETMAAIYLGQITMWNDDRIKALNSIEVVAGLPVQPIIVITQSISSSVTQAFTTALNLTVPEFSAQVGAGTLVSYPVQADVNRSIVTGAVDGIMSNLRDVRYSFTTWLAYEILLSRTLGVVSLKKSDGTVVHPTVDSVKVALNDYLSSGSGLAYDLMLLGKSADAWPIATFASFIYRQRTMRDCKNAAALADFMYWSQSDANARRIATRQGFVMASDVQELVKRMYLLLDDFTCNGEHVSSLHGCVTTGGELCSGAGTCAEGQCACNSGREGKYCEAFTSSSDDNRLTILLATIIPVGAVILLLLLGCIAALMGVITRSGRESDDWEIDYNELEVGEQLGAGGFGQVFKATWKGTEVAVKVVAADKISREMEKSFKDEVRVMTALRHPNVVLFMAASTKPPKMCIVMEFMALGSLFDLLHNELIPELPFALKAKMAYQASKGMHFLHSSGIVHRDLKSLNLLLDSKWNVKVSDFGLTKFKDDIDKGGGADHHVGSVHWTAPEILNETPDVDYVLADVYSFGIILWELLTREQPFFGLSPAAVAVAVIRDGLRPRMPAPEEQMVGAHPVEFEELITCCWHTDPVIRPTFLEIMTRLSAMHGDAAGSYTSTTNSSSGGRSAPAAKPSYGSSWTLPPASGSASNSSTSNSPRHSAVAAGTGAVRAPEGEVAIVFTDITRAASLWEFNAAAMRDATLAHNHALRSALAKHRGYEVVFIRERNSGEGSFCMAFQHPADALAWCADVQRVLLDIEWPEALLDHPGAAEEWGDTDDRVLFRGLRVRMGVHVGTPKVVQDPMTRRVEYIGPAVNAAARITALTHGGQIVASQAAMDKVRASDPSWERLNRVSSLGRFEMPDVPQGSKLFEIQVAGLEGRFFGGVTHEGNVPSANSNSGGGGSSTYSEGRAGRSHATVSAGSRDGRDYVETVVGEGMAFKEDNFLTSANLCRWIIDFGEIQVGKQIGLGSYGVVYRGKWKGVDVAVKKFIKQQLDERRMLEFRAEMAFLSELHHPNIVLFIGACVKRPNLCIVTEFVKQGNLKDILANNAIKLTWQRKLKLLRGAALGITYLHSLHPVIVHRDLKPSNLLVDETWNVKVADFGFARIKEENATMTRCGTPCWTAPEVIRGDKYGESADVFSFGVVMWEVLTRRQPYAGRNFMGVSLDVLEGRRPQIPGDCPGDFRRVMKRCWHANPDRRPRMEDVLAFFDKHHVDDGGGAGDSMA